MKGITKSGYQYDVRDNIKKDFRFIRVYKQLSKPKSDEDAIIAANDFIEIVVGEDGVNRLMEHVADEDGYVSVEKMMNEIGEILRLVGEQEKEVKNFYSSPT